MRYLKLFESFNKSEIHLKCKRYDIHSYTINKDGSIDVDSYVELSNIELKKLPLKFNKVNRYFDCSWNGLASLKGSPSEINSDFLCNENKLTSFKYSPKIIRGTFNCANNNIESFEYFPSFVKGGFFCDNNPIYEVWRLFRDTTKIELLNDFDIFRDEDIIRTIIMDRLNDFLLTIGKETVGKVYQYKNI